MGDVTSLKPRLARKRARERLSQRPNNEKTLLKSLVPTDGSISISLLTPPRRKP